MKKLIFAVIALFSLVGGTSCNGQDNAINGHEYVDLGLSVKWATCNVGARSPEDFGDYFAWGEISTREVYDGNSNVPLDETIDISGDPKYDAARANWGGTWRMPSKEEQDELKEKCEWILTTKTDAEGYEVNGYFIRSKVNGNSIFLPAAGYRSNLSLSDAGCSYCYRNSSREEEGSCITDYYTGGICWFGDCFSNGFPIRPVSE